jgi:8-oxo-dGTP pyrophosphatase MutT (NUDIX family)
LTDRGPRSWRPGGDQIIPRPERWTLGDEPPWTDRHDGSLPLLVDDVIARVRNRGAGHAVDEHDPDAWISAVLIALVEGPLGAEVLLTKRSWQMRNHRGEISFPGGRVDPGESPPEAALREAHEEVGLDPSLVVVEGELDHVSTFVSRSYIVPVVARLTARPALAPASPEVQRVLFVPLAELYRSDTYRSERWWRAEYDRPIHFFELDDETIWGATGRILVQLLSVAVGVDHPISGI